MYFVYFYNLPADHTCMPLTININTCCACIHVQQTVSYESLEGCVSVSFLWYMHMCVGISCMKYIA